MYLSYNKLNSSSLLSNSQLSLQQKDDSLYLGRHRKHVWWLGRPTGCNARLISCPSLISNKPFPSPWSCVGVSRKTLPRLHAGALSVCVCVWAGAPLLRKHFSCSLVQCTEEGVLSVWCSSSSAPPDARRLLPHNLWPLQPSELSPSLRRLCGPRSTIIFLIVLSLQTLARTEMLTQSDRETDR